MCTCRLHSQYWDTVSICILSPVPTHPTYSSEDWRSFHTQEIAWSLSNPLTHPMHLHLSYLCVKQGAWHKAKRLTKCLFFKLCVALYRKIFTMPSCLVWSFPPTSFPATVLPHSSLWFSCGIGLGLNCWSGASVYISESLPTFSRSVISSPTLRVSRCESGINNS